MKNVSMSMDTDGKTLIIKIDTSVRLGKSASGKTTIVASTEGNITPQGLDPSMKLGVNLYTK